MSLTEQQFNDLSASDKFKLYLESKVDREAFTELSNKFSAALEKIDACQKRIEILESGAEICKTVNSTLSESFLKLKKKLNRLDQYGRRENVVISGFPDNCTDTEDKLLKILDKVGCSVSKAQITACHPMKKKGYAIVRFANRKHAEKVLQARKKIKSIDTFDIWGENRTHYISENLSPEYLRLRWLAKNLKNKDVIADFGVNKNGVWIKKDSNDQRFQVDAEEDFINFFPIGKTLVDYIN